MVENTLFKIFFKLLIDCKKIISDGTSQLSFLDLFHPERNSEDLKSADSCWLQYVSIEQLNLMTGIFRPATDLNVYQSLINTIQQCTLPKHEYISVLAYFILFDSEYAFEVENIRTALFEEFVAKSGTNLQLSELMATLVNMSAFTQVT